MISINLSVLVLLLALALSCGQEARQDSATQTETTIAVQTPVEATSVAADTRTPEPGRDTPPSPPVPSVSGRVVILGILAVAIGDPPDSGRARQAASLRDSNGKLWRLVFDGDVFPAPASLFDWNLKRVNVEGMLTGEADTVLVTFITLAPP